MIRSKTLRPHVSCALSVSNLHQAYEGTKGLAANPFGVLAGQPQSPAEPDWDFNPRPTTSDRAARRRVRGGQRQKAKRAAQKQRDEYGSEGIDELCRSLANLRLDNDVSVQQPAQPMEQRSVPIAKPIPGFSSDSVRHHWAPQFRPNKLPTPPPETFQTTEMLVPTSPLQIPKRTFSGNTLSLAPKKQFSFRGTESLVTTELRARYPHNSEYSNEEYKSEHTSTHPSLVFPFTSARRGILAATGHTPALDKIDFRFTPLENPLLA